MFSAKSTFLFMQLQHFDMSNEWFYLNKVNKGKGKVHPIIGHEGPEGRRSIAPLFL
jgi:hypothetical protein